MAIKLSSNPTCVLSDADNLTAEQRQKINMNLTKGIPGSNISGDKVTVINSDGEVEMKAYSAGGGGSSYTAGDGIDISEGIISAKVDNVTIGFTAEGILQAYTSSSSALYQISYPDTSDSRAVRSFVDEIGNALNQDKVPYVVYSRTDYDAGDQTGESLFLSHRRTYSNNDGADDTMYYFVGTKLDNFSGDHHGGSGTLKHWIVVASKTYDTTTSNYQYAVTSYVTTQTGVTASTNIGDF